MLLLTYLISAFGGGLITLILPYRAGDLGFWFITIPLCVLWGIIVGITM